jgi:hypothetical protein
MMSDDAQSARLFSHVYLGGGERLQDSQRARIRVSKHLGNMQVSLSEVGDLIERERGVKVLHAEYYTSMEKFITECALKDFLDLITLVWLRYGSSHNKVKSEWLVGWVSPDFC